MTVKAETILEILEEKHKDWITIRELRLSSGFENAGRIDLWTIDPSPSTGNQAISYEIKISKQDFKKDTFEKQRGARLFADKFYYVTPKGLLKPTEIPDWAGLIEVIPSAPKNFRCKVIVQSPKLDKAAPSWGLVVSILRRGKLEGLVDSYDRVGNGKKPKPASIPEVINMLGGSSNFMDGVANVDLPDSLFG